MNAFERAFIETIDLEGGYVNGSCFILFLRKTLQKDAENGLEKY